MVDESYRVCIMKHWPALTCTNMVYGYLNSSFVSRSLSPFMSPSPTSLFGTLMIFGENINFAICIHFLFFVVLQRKSEAKQSGTMKCMLNLHYTYWCIVRLIANTREQKTCYLFIYSFLCFTQSRFFVSMKKDNECNTTTLNCKSFQIPGMLSFFLL